MSPVSSKKTTSDKQMPVSKKLKLGILFSGIILLAEFIGALVSNSLALLSDAGHVLTDVLALSLSYFALMQAKRPSNFKMTFGYHRIGVLVAILNSVSLIGIAVFIFYESFQRFQNPPEINAGLVLPVALLGLATNLTVALILHHEQKENLNIKSAFWHAAGDALASVGVIISAVVIIISGNYLADIVVSIIIGLIISLGGVNIFRQGLRVILEASPKDINLNQLADSVKTIPGVKDFHHIHIWSISPEIHALSAHVLIDDCPVSQADDIRQHIETILKESFALSHVTLQMECRVCRTNDILCQLEIEQKPHLHKHH
ncbi:MAG: cation transporter [Dehalococcoides mccartyi]|uniref:Cation transporter n=2 Tax=Dehalococcoides mccartyi TaxID=61435 RepID=A0A0V8LXS3_9CHLR|nr:cation transporter [Dehalococcoides mccartyi]OBW60813.1 MAG: cation transporter [Dehalococcoides mccartyi]